MLSAPSSANNRDSTEAAGAAKTYSTNLETRSPLAASTEEHVVLQEVINMRIHEGNFAYDLEQPRDPQTQLALNWRFTVYQLRPTEQVIARGEANTKEEAEKKAKSAVTRLANKERKIAA